MPARHKSRQKAMQILFLWDFSGLGIDEAISTFYSSLYAAEQEEEKGIDVDVPAAQDLFMETLARGCAQEAESINALIVKCAANWRLDRMPVVDRNILRMAIYELKFVGTPPAVVIDEALELARRYSEEDAVPFINGVLDAVRKTLLQGEQVSQTAG